MKENKIKIPDKLVPLKTKSHNGKQVVLAEGEAHNHSHGFESEDDVCLMTDEAQTTVVVNVKNTAPLKHEEHSPHVIQEGQGVFIQQAQMVFGQYSRALD